MHVRTGILGQAVLGVALLFPLLTGCRQQEEPRQPPLVEVRIRQLNSLYNAFGAIHHKKPANMEELRGWAKKLSKTKLAELRVDDVDEVLISPRDNQPYVVVNGGPAGPWMVVLHEKTGQDGKRYVMTAMGSALELDDAAMKLVVK